MARPRKSFPETFEPPVSTALMVCNKAGRCLRAWSCRHKKEHWASPACGREIPDKLSVCFGSRCKEVPRV
jgi:hypothetical protein